MPARLPRAVKLLRGTLEKHRDNPAAPQVPTGKVPPPPRGLSATAKRIWLELAEELDHLQVYAPSDRTAFRLLVLALAEIEDAGPDTPPTAKVRLLQTTGSMLGSFGMTPASRDRVSTTPAPSQDPVEADLFGPSASPWPPREA